MMIRYNLLILAGALALMFVPTLGQACPKCFASTSPHVLYAYYVSVAFMALLPLGIVGSIVTWLHFQKRQVRRDHEE
jgi:hypothetical protein